MTLVHGIDAPLMAATGDDDLSRANGFRLAVSVASRRRDVNAELAGR